PRLAGAGADVAAGAGAGADAAAVAGLPSVSMVAIVSLATTVPPSPFMILTSTPESGAGVSSTTLSVSMSTRFSSRLTKSPTLRCHDTSVASATDSESCGTFTSTSMLAPGGAALDGLHRAVGARRRAHGQREIDELLLLLFVQRLVAGGRRRPRIAARINKLLVRQQMPQQVMLDAMPRALIARLFLAPHDFGCVLVLFDLHLERVVRERIQLGNADQRNIGNAAFAPPRAQIVKNFAAAEDDALHVRGIYAVVPLLVDGIELVIREFLERRHRLLVPQQALRRKDDQRLAVRAHHLTAQQVIHLHRGSRHADLHVVVGAHLQKTLDAARRMLGARAFVAVRQHHREPAQAAPLDFARHDELVDDDLRAVDEIAVLRLPYHELIRA